MKKSILIFAITVFTILFNTRGFASGNIDFSNFGEYLPYHKSKIEIQKDSSLIVTETIKYYVSKNLDHKKRGIKRTIPFILKDGINFSINTPIEIISIKKNNKTEPYHIETSGQFKKIYIGDENTYLPADTYTYEIKYKTENHIRYFETFDEINFDIIGTKTDFPIKEVIAEVILPKGSMIKQFDAYTGKYKEKGKDWKVISKQNRNLILKTTRPLKPKEAFTVAVGFTKGIVYEPTATEKKKKQIQDNIHLIIIVILAIFLFLYYFWAWDKVGRDPEKGAIIPHYESPENLDPADIRYILNMSFDNKAFAAELINFAVKGYIKIEKSFDDFYLVKNKLPQSASYSDRKIIHHLFDDEKRVKLSNKNASQIRKAKSSLRNHLKANYFKKYFKLNGFYLIPGILISVVTVIYAILFLNFKTNDARFGVIFLSFWLSIWSIGVYFLTKELVISFKKTASRNILLKIIKNISFTLFTLPFLLGEIGAFAGLLFLSPLEFVLLIAYLISTNITFGKLIKAPTSDGRKLMDQIEGFRLYLETAEKHRLEFSTSEKEMINKEKFEKFLPYAMALDVENKWNKTFEQYVKNNNIKQTTPTWLIGSDITNATTAITVTAIASTLSDAFTSSISASTYTGSSSGGGGFSGGGSGGGGTSSW